MKFEQKAFREKRSFSIEEHGINCEIVKARHHKKQFVPYEHLLKERRRRVQAIAGFFYLAGLCAAVAVSSVILKVTGHPLHLGFALICVLLALLSLLAYQLTRRHYVLIGVANGRDLVFLKDNPSPVELQDFIREAFSRRDSYLRAQYFYLDPGADPERELRRMRWLIEQRVVTETELSLKKREPGTAVEWRVN